MSSSPDAILGPRNAPGSWALSSLGLAGLTALFFAPVLAGGVFFQSDFLLVFEPLRHALGIALHGGAPLWTPLIGNGVPLAASPFMSAFYPPNLAFALSGIPAARVLTLLLVLHVVFGAAGQLLWLRARGFGPAASGAGAALFAFCGATVSSLYFVVLVTTAVWIPWLLLANEELLSARGRRQTVLAALGVAAASLAMVLSGDPFMLLAGLAGVAITSLRRGAGEPPLGRALARTAAAVALGLALATPLFVAWARYVPETVRALGYSKTESVFWSLHPIELLELVLPAPFGDPIVEAGPGSLARGLHAGYLPLVTGRYAGILPLALAVYGAVRLRRTSLLVWLALLLALALGEHTPLYDLLLRLRYFRWSRYPMKWLVAAAIPLGAAAAAGLEALSRDVGDPRGRRAATLASAVLACAALAAALLAPSLAGPLSRAFAREQAAGDGHPTGDAASIAPVLESRLAGSARLALLPLAAALLGSLALAKSGWTRAVPFLVAGVLAADLLLQNRGLQPTTARDEYERAPQAVRLIEADAGERGRVWVDSLPATVGARFRRERLQVYTAASSGLSVAFPTDVEGLAPLRYAQLARLVRTLPASARDALLDVSGVTHVLSFSPPSACWRLLGTCPVGADRPASVYRNLGALPRIRRVTALVAHDGVEGFVASLEDPGILRRAVAVDARDLGGFLKSAPPRRGYLEVPLGGSELGTDRPPQVIAETGRALKVRVSGGRCFLFVSDTWVTGWRAYVDGREMPLFPADLAFRAVPVPAGEHEVEMRYDPF